MYCCLNMFLLMFEIALVLDFEAFPPKILSVKEKT